MIVMEVRKHLREANGQFIEIITKKSEKICGRLCWISPDNSMVEISLKNGQIKTLTDVDIKTVRIV